MDHDVFYDDGPPISQLQAAVKALEGYVHEVVPPDRTPPPLRSLSANDQHHHPTPIEHFSRQEFVADQWRQLRNVHVAVYGLNGIGALVAEALVRAGIGKLLIVDHSTPMPWSALGEMGYHPEDIGFSRVQALRLKLQSIHTVMEESVTFESFTINLLNECDMGELKKKLQVSCVGTSVNAAAAAKAPQQQQQANNFGLFEALTLKRPYDALLCCSEEQGHKMRLNQLCLELSLPLLDIALSPCNCKVLLHTVLPGHTCCLECVKEMVNLHSSGNQVTKHIARVFPASLPHVQLTAAGLLAQNVIKYFVDIGEFVPFFQLDLLTFEMDSYTFPPNPCCPNQVCLERQRQEAKYH